MYRAYEVAIQYIQARERTGRKRGNGKCAGGRGGCAHERRRSTAERRQAESMTTGDRLCCAQASRPGNHGKKYLAFRARVLLAQRSRHAAPGLLLLQPAHGGSD